MTGTVTRTCDAITAPTGDEVDARFERIACWFDDRVSRNAASQEAAGR